MTYLDFSATTKISDDALKETMNNLFDKATESDLNFYQKEIKTLLNTNLDVIFTSGSSESNNYAIKGIMNNKKEIITSHFEHSSINETLKSLTQEGYIVKYVKVKDKELDLEDLEKLINDNTALITITSVNSEIGMINDINAIGKIAKKYGIPFHSDMTQSIGKMNIPLANVDLVSFSSHKFYGPKGVGVLLKRKDIKLKPLIYGNRTYNLGLIKGMTKALQDAQKSIDKNYKKTEDLRSYLKDNIISLPNIIINEGKKNIPNILNISVKNYKPETFLHYLELNDIYISTKSACSTGDYSEAVYALTNDINLAKTSVRISLSSDTLKTDLDKVIDLIKRSDHGN